VSTQLQLKINNKIIIIIIDQKSLGNIEMWCWRRMERISWTDLCKTKSYYTVSRGRGISYRQ
jgi:hypothetical protein